MKKVLITDDEPRIVRLIQHMIDWQGLCLELVGVAGNGVDALEILTSTAVDILIADVKMPGMDGLELADRAMEYNPKLAVIIISGYREFEYAYTALKKGVCDYLIKPINQQDLDKSLRRILNLHQTSSVVLQEELVKFRRERMAANCVHGIADIREDLEVFNGQGGFSFLPGLFGALAVRVLCPDGGISLDVALNRICDLVTQAMDGCCHDVVCILARNCCYCLFNLDEGDRGAVVQTLKDLKITLDARIAQELALPVILGVGSLRPRHTHLPQSCAEAMLCCKSIALVDAGQPIFAEKLQVGTAQSVISVQQELAFSGTVAKYDAAALDGAVDTLIEQVLPTLQKQPWQMEFFVHELLELFAKELSKVKVEISSDELEQVACTLLSRQSLAELVADLCGWFHQMLQQYHDMVSDKYRKPIHLARSYIERHFAEQISLADICEEVGFSYTYFSALFKQETGESIVDYMTQTRIQHAKQLLTTTKLNVQAIANQSGYADMKHFSKTFEKIVGIRPMEYRKLRS